MSTKLIHGIDPSAPDGIARLLAYHRGIYGNLVMTAGPAVVPGQGGGDGNLPAGGQGAPAVVPSATPPAPVLGPDGKPFDPARAIADLGKARADMKAERDRATAADTQLKAVLKALGMDTAPDPAKLTEQLTERDTAVKLARVENLVLRTAGKAGADGDALLDSRGFAAKLASIDPDADDAGTRVDAEIKAWLVANPRYAVAPARQSGSSTLPGANGSGGPGGGEQRAAKSLGEATANFYRGKNT